MYGFRKVSVFMVAAAVRAGNKRSFSSTAAINTAKVAVLGAAGGIGQPLSLLLKHNELISNLSLFDIVNTPGVAADLSHISTHSKVTGYLPDNDGLQHAVSDASIIVIPAGVPLKDLATAAAKYAPNAFLAVISNPVNSTVPIVSEIFKKFGVYDPKKIFGVTTLDIVRAARFVSEIRGTNPKHEKVTVVGGHSGVTIIPLLSQLNANFTEEEIKALTHRIQFGGDEVVKAKAGTGSATLSMAYAAARFTDSLLRALVIKEAGIIEPTYIKSNLFASKGIEYFASNVEIDSEGVKQVFPLGRVSPYEEQLVEGALPDLKNSIEKGIKFVQNN
ncbi:7601_t:CDS:2 [Diversispora eburnea]|uniref:Malate dehydrogenase n=1 Tax=Diversispora eburnea TaxID=1213867 RepID=A0A9N9A7Z6_9GLOM|nr:7601_t:CDS:2 [Diversispora eburnea]